MEGSHGEAEAETCGEGGFHDGKGGIQNYLPFFCRLVTGYQKVRRDFFCRVCGVAVGWESIFFAKLTSSACLCGKAGHFEG